MKSSNTTFDNNSTELTMDKMKKKVSDIWSEKIDDNYDFSSKVYWLAIPEVHRRYSTKLSGDPQGSWKSYCCDKYLSNRLPVKRMAVVGCGNGRLDRGLASLNAFVDCDAFDISDRAIEFARTEAENLGISNIHYIHADIEDYQFPINHYDAVWFKGSLHHIKQLEHVCQGLARSLTKDGFLFIEEYVGPIRFALTDRQKEVLNAVFALIPKKYRKSFFRDYSGLLQNQVSIPNPQQVKKVDPSEAVRSSDILPVLSQYFDIVEQRELGGTLLHFLLHGIAGNFVEEDPDSMKVLQLLFSIEDVLIEVGDLNSDFISIAANPKQ